VLEEDLRVKRDQLVQQDLLDPMDHKEFKDR
jgi:hypothetical protein